MPGSLLLPFGKWRLTLIILPCFVLGLFGWLRFAAALREWEYLIELGLSPGPLYLAMGGAVWGVLGWGAALLAGLRPRGDWNWPAVFIAVLGMALSYWGDLLVFTRPAEMLVNWPFTLVVTVAGLAYLFFLLRLPRWWRARKEAANVHE